MGFSHTSSTRSGASRDSFHGCVAAFVEHLKQEGLTAGRIRNLRASARHFLVWLDQEGIEIGWIDDAVLRRFRRHDCRCPGMERERRKMLARRSRQFVSGALRLVRFFEHTRRIQHPGELDEGLRLLEEFLTECAADGYAPRFDHGLSKCLPPRPGVASSVAHPDEADGCQGAGPLRRT